MNEIILETKSLCKTFKKQEAVKDVSISVQKNSIYGLLGPNGAGKSTLLKMITGMLRPSSGEILFYGHKWSRKDLSEIGSLIEIMKSEKESLLEKKQINLMKFIDDIVGQGISISINKQLKFKNEVENIPEFILVDKAALKRVISNVISNAVDYCPRNGEILLSVDCNDKNLQFIIEDSGRGFTKEELNSATEQFFQGNKSRNSKDHYGMGLYIARKLMEKHNGNISLENSEKLGGAKVIVKIPV